MGARPGARPGFSKERGVVVTFKWIEDIGLDDLVGGAPVLVMQGYRVRFPVQPQIFLSSFHRLTSGLYLR